MTQTMASPAGDTPLYSYIDMTASHPTALSLSYTMHPPYVTVQVSRRTSQNTLSPSWAGPGARSAATTRPSFGECGVPLVVPQAGMSQIIVGATSECEVLVLCENI